MNIRIVKGNHKLPASTYILNMGSATDCPSRKRGLCQAGKACYALKAEIQYPNCLPARRKDTAIWKATSAVSIAAQLLATSERARVNKMTAFRFSESGDFETQWDITKMSTVCEILSNEGIETYGYTARTDLNLFPLLKQTSVNVSNDKGHWVEQGANRFKMVGSTTGGNLVCAGDCRGCTLCFAMEGQTIEILAH